MSRLQAAATGSGWRLLPPLTVLFRTLLFCCLLSACATAPWGPHTTTGVAQDGSRAKLDKADVASYLRQVLLLGHEDLQQEINWRRERANSSRSSVERAKLALAISLPTQGQRDTTRALLAITEVPRDDPALDANAIAIINYVQALLAWQAHQEEALQTLTTPERASTGAMAGAGVTPGPSPELASLQALLQRLRADQRRSDAQIETLNARLRDEKTRGDSLQLKLDALGNLEKSLAERKSGHVDTQR